MSLLSEHELSQDLQFRGKVKSALMKRAATALASSDELELRRARSVIYAPEDWAGRISSIIASTAGIDTSSTDAQIQTAVDTAWTGILA